MKIIKHILSFLLLLILQLSFANVYLNEDKVVGRIEFSDKPNSDFSEPSYRENNIFKASFFWIVSFRSISLCDGYAELVESWKLLDEANVSQVLKIDPDNLKAVNDFVTTKGIDHSMLKAEFDAIGANYHEDLIKSFKISNGSESYPVLKNTLPPSTDGALYGTFVNGQFVPTANAPVGGTWDFVVTTSGEIKVGSKHSWLANGGEDVLAAGELRISGGVIEEITNASGHYTPTVGEGMNYLRLLKKQGVDINSAHLYLNKYDPDLGFIEVRDIHPYAPTRKLFE